MKTLLIDITKMCNLRCTHCYNSDYFESKEDSDFHNTLSLIQNNKSSIAHIHLLGGEPLVRKDIFEFIDGVPEGINISINTNGTKLDKDNSLKVINRDCITQLTISLDGHDEESNSLIRGRGVFELVSQNLLLLDELKTKYNSSLELNLAFVVTPDNIHSIKHLPSIADKLKFNRIMISFLYEEGNALTNFNTKYNFNDLSNSLIDLIKSVKSEKIEVLLDMKPAFQQVLEMKMGFQHNLKYQDEYKCEAMKKNYYISANEELFPCGPASKLEKNLSLCGIQQLNEVNVSDLDDCILNYEMESKFCVSCMFNEVCFRCPIGVKYGSENMCQEAIAIINDEVSKIVDVVIKKEDSYQIVNKNGRLYHIDFNDKFMRELSNNEIDLNILFSSKLGDLGHIFDSHLAYNRFLLKISYLRRTGKLGGNQWT